MSKQFHNLRPFFHQPLDGVRLVRREMLRVGAAGLVGLSLPQLLGAQNLLKKTARAKNLILMFLEGGPAHQDTWDMKPEARPRFVANLNRSLRRYPGS